SRLLNVVRDEVLAASYPEIKDPDLVRLPDGGWMMLASVGNSSVQQWVVGRFTAEGLDGPWRELEPVRFHGLSGPELCAPSTVCRREAEGDRWRMYIQTACFSPDGRIISAESADGQNFYPSSDLLVTKESIVGDLDVIGVYDVGVTEITINSDPYECLAFSGYRRVGSGDLYAAFRSKLAPELGWTTPVCILRQEAVPFHNHPEYEHHEWGLEGAKILQISETCYLLVGVCFLQRDESFLGMRQRVFFAGSRTPNGRFIPLGTAIEPFTTGENGHPDAVIEEGRLVLIYQERLGDGQPWHLRHAEFDLDALARQIAQACDKVSETDEALSPV
ncbi:MAG TPA: hypothetical protein VFN77_03545, partial [Acetobacteraceae bacterium]|nr:hypothetical protein [Acetobacteraceae bacterium]